MKSLHRIANSTLILLGTANFLYCQQDNIKFERLSLDQGLSQSTVTCILRDSRGFIWIGTQDGLNRYDGYKFKIYRSDPLDSNSLSNNFVRSMCEDRFGTVWIGTDFGGVNQFDRGKDNFIRYKHDPKNPGSLSHNVVWKIFEDGSGTLWIGTTDGLNRFDRAQKSFTQFKNNPNEATSLSHNNVHAIVEDRAGLLWIGTDGGGLNAFDREKGRFYAYKNDPTNANSLSDNNVEAIIEDRSGRMWIGTRYGGLNAFDKQKQTFTRYQHDSTNVNSLSNNFIWSIFEDSLGGLWIGTYRGGLDRFDRDKGTFIHYQNNPADPTSLSSNIVLTIFEDRSGMLWVGTAGGGLNTFARKRFKFTHYKKDPNRPTDFNIVPYVVEDTYGGPKVLWIGTYSGGLYKLDREKGQYKLFKHAQQDPHSISSDFILSIFIDNAGTLWVGTQNGGVNKFDRATEQFAHYMHDPNNPSSLSHNDVPQIYEDSFTDLWFGTLGGGLDKFDREKQIFTHFQQDPQNPNTLSQNAVRMIYEDRSHRLWIGTQNGLNKFDRSTETFKHFLSDPEDSRTLSNNRINAILEDHRGNLWIGTDGGLNKLIGQSADGGFNKTSPQFVRYSTKHGLPNDVVNGILEDEDGNLWMSTNRGISKFNPATETFRNYDVDDGLQSNEFNNSAYHITRSGEMFFAGVNGFNSFYPRMVSDNPFIPPVVITAFRKFNQEASLDTSIGEIRTIQLPYDVKVFSIEFSSLNYLLPQKNLYAYKMEGFNKDWIYSGTKREATYTNLDPGEYTFRVKGSNNDGVWNEAGTFVNVVILPPYWKTWWFRALVLLAISSLAVGIYRYRVAQLLKVERMRLRIASDLHDDIGSNLSSISLSSQMLLRDLTLGEYARSQIDRIGANALKTADTMKDIVWLINPENDKLDDLVLRMKDVASSLLRNIEYTLNCPNENLDRSVDLEVKRNVFLIYKELLNNIAKHSRATRAAIVVKHDENVFHLSVEDDGRGFDLSKASDGNGLKNIRRRANSMKSTVDIQSTPGKGTRVALTVKIT